MKLLQETKSKFLRNLFLSEFQIGTETRKRAPSLGSQFKKSLDSLMNILSACQPFFIRCIKPNEYKTPDVSPSFFVHRLDPSLNLGLRSRPGLPAIALLGNDGNDQHSKKRLPDSALVSRFRRSIPFAGSGHWTVALRRRLPLCSRKDLQSSARQRRLSNRQEQSVPQGNEPHACLAARSTPPRYF